jgi:hypothetical protein
LQDAKGVIEQFDEMQFAVDSAMPDATMWLSGRGLKEVIGIPDNSDTKMTRHYARVLDKSIMRDMAVVNEKFAKHTTDPDEPQTPSQPQDPVQVPNPVATTTTSSAHYPSIDTLGAIPNFRSDIVN